MISVAVMTKVRAGRSTALIANSCLQSWNLLAYRAGRRICDTCEVSGRASAM